MCFFPEQDWLRGGAPDNIGDASAKSSANAMPWFAGFPSQRVGNPLEVANAILFLASDEASYVTGAGFLVDGGLRTA